MSNQIQFIFGRIQELSSNIFVTEIVIPPYIMHQVNETLCYSNIEN